MILGQLKSFLNYKGFSIIFQKILAAIGFNGAETNRGIARILGILLMNSCDTQIYIYFSNYIR